jgi:hypothetical protein
MKIAKKIQTLIIVSVAILSVGIPIVMAWILYHLDGFVDGPWSSTNVMAVFLLIMGFLMLIIFLWIFYRFAKRYGWYRFKREILNIPLTDEEHEEFHDY